MRGKLVHELKLLLRVRVWEWVRVMVKFGTSSTFRGWVRQYLTGDARLEFLRNSARRLKMRERIERAG